MQSFKLSLAVALAAVALPAVAQTTTADPGTPHKPLPYDRGYDKDTPRTRAINDAARPGVESANAEVLASAQAQTSGGTADSAQYSRDMAAYRQALRTRRHVANADMRRYDRQQRAYADAMRDWRRQSYACHHGSRRACRAPTPNPANYW
ncbi:conserved exported hypothetical protein [Sphingomonas sp. EC-HK361]|uniref:hypothetical protein n=1 Tax=Sphingomonas sp. EC-HK361 TaxID=2038397 RepID=UPI00125B580B|nr:hypothetical protein [Sphingomonas sp. EC-HK361]VVT02257.1 conserved exported hypothetical protein [Sphingomonas sp. EC-HK361]